MNLYNTTAASLNGLPLHTDFHEKDGKFVWGSNLYHPSSHTITQAVYEGRLRALDPPLPILFLKMVYGASFRGRGVDRFPQSEMLKKLRRKRKERNNDTS